jgi:hypothetical protein
MKTTMDQAHRHYWRVLYPEYADPKSKLHYGNLDVKSVLDSFIALNSEFSVELPGIEPVT